MIITRSMRVESGGWVGKITDVQHGFATVRWNVGTPTPVRNQEVPLDTLTVRTSLGGRQVVRFRSEVPTLVRHQDTLG